VLRKAQAESRNPVQQAMLAAELPVEAESWFHASRSRGAARAYVNAALPALLEERAAVQA
jgi:hypothetical protein